MIETQGAKIRIFLFRIPLPRLSCPFIVRPVLGIKHTGLGIARDIIDRKMDFVRDQQQYWTKK